MRKNIGIGMAALAVVAGITGLAAPALALPPPGGGTDPGGTTVDRPDLRVTALAATPVGSNWSISYTVANSGLAAAGASTLALGGNGLSTSVAIPSLAANATRSGTLQVPQTDCYLALTGRADSTSSVTESNETNNIRNATSALPGCPPRYRVSAVSFHADDESGYDWTGSDEPYWIFNRVGTSGTSVSTASQVFEGIDTGDTQSFGLADSCLWGCGSSGAPAPTGIGLSVQLWEKDLGHVSQTLYDTADFFQQAGPILTEAGAPSWIGTATTKIGQAMNYILSWADDDLLGSNTYAFSSSDLATALPSRGTSFTDVRTYTDGDAKYSLTMVVSRIV